MGKSSMNGGCSIAMFDWQRVNPPYTSYNHNLEPLPWGRLGHLGQVPVEAAWGHRRAAHPQDVVHDLDLDDLEGTTIYIHVWKPPYGMQTGYRVNHIDTIDTPYPQLT